MKKLLLPVALLFVVTLPAIPPRVATISSASPNVVIIMTDDQRWDTVNSSYMPRLSNLVLPNAISFTNSFVPNSLCCPSRSSTLTGDYSHTTGVFGNGGQYGGFMSFTPPPEGASTSPVDDTTTIATDFHNAGYRTALVGRYLNEYPGKHFGYVPPGWDSWFSVGNESYYNYYVAVNGRKLFFGSDPKDYSTRVLAHRAETFIASSALSGTPFFLYLATTAPHGPAIPDPRDAGRFDLSGWQKPPSWGGSSSSDPKYIQDLEWDAAQGRSTNDFHKMQLDSIYGVDRAIGQIWRALPDNTVVLFMSDNGVLWGEHKWNSKQVPYNESVRVPIVLAYKGADPPFATGVTDPRIVLNVDVAPTLEGLAGITPSHPIEGEDMLTSSRTEFVTEHWDNDEGVPTYCGIRSVDWMYVKYNEGEEPVSVGLYDENADPYEMNNLAVTDPNDPTVAAELTQMNSDASTLCTQGTVYPPDWPFQRA